MSVFNVDIASPRGRHFPAGPARHAFEDSEIQDVALGEALLEASSSQDTGLGDLAVLVPTRALVEHFVTTIGDLGLATQNLEEYEGAPTPAVKVGTYKRAKGLEFKQVFLPSLDLVDIEDVEDVEDGRADTRELVRRALFVALTRARDRIWLSGVASEPDRAWWVAETSPRKW